MKEYEIKVGFLIKATAFYLKGFESHRNIS